jgi:hypothetical protein
MLWATRLRCFATGVQIGSIGRVCLGALVLATAGAAAKEAKRH